MIGQCCVYERGGQRLSRTCLASVASLLLGCCGLLAAAQSSMFPEVRTLDFMYVIGYIKASGALVLCTPAKHCVSCLHVLQASASAISDAVQVGITCAKYAPQVLLNFQRKSTDGFAILPVLCDITGSHRAC